MKIATGSLPQVVAEYFDSVVIPAANQAGGVVPFLTGLAAGLAARRVPELLNQYSDVLQALGVINQGMVDIDLLVDEAKASLEKHPLVVGGYKVDVNDLDVIHSLLEKHGV